MSDLPAVKRQEVDESLRSAADESIASIYRRFGLATEGVLLDSFYKYARAVRRTAAVQRMQEAGTPDTAGDVPSMDALRDRLLVSMYEAAQAGGVKPYELASMYARVQEFDRLALIREAEKRRDEKHRLDMEERRKKQETALEDVSKVRRLSPEDVKEIREKVLGLV